jgi:hypothetical protein
VVFSKKRDCHKLLWQFIQLRIAKGAPLAAEDAGSMALVPHNEEQPQAGHLSCEVFFRCCLWDCRVAVFQGAKEDHGRLFSIAIDTMIYYDYAALQLVNYGVCIIFHAWNIVRLHACSATFLGSISFSDVFGRFA